MVANCKISFMTKNVIRLFIRIHNSSLICPFNLTSIQVMGSTHCLRGLVDQFQVVGSTDCLSGPVNSMLYLSLSLHLSIQKILWKRTIPQLETQFTSAVLILSLGCTYSFGQKKRMDLQSKRTYKLCTKRRWKNRTNRTVWAYQKKLLNFCALLVPEICMSHTTRVKKKVFKDDVSKVLIKRLKLKIPIKKMFLFVLNGLIWLKRDVLNESNFLMKISFCPKTSRHPDKSFAWEKIHLICCHFELYLLPYFRHIIFRNPSESQFDLIFVSILFDHNRMFLCVRKYINFAMLSTLQNEAPDDSPSRWQSVIHWNLVESQKYCYSKNYLKNE